MAQSAPPVARDGDALTTRPVGAEPAAPSPAELEETVFRAFAPGEFLEWPPWTRLQKILRTNGGSYGISGPRGSGKSWLMLRAIEDVKDPSDEPNSPGIGLWYPSPSEYNALAFLASLLESLASEIERRYRRLHGIRNPPVWTAVSLALAAAGTATLLTQLWQGWSWRWAILGVAATALVGAFAIQLWARLREQQPERRLLREAELARERARFSATRREASEVGAEGGQGITARLGISRERELVERPATLSTLVNDLRALAELAGEVTGRVIIAIDELDKMTDPDGVRELLRDIKGIFEVPRVHFLVSVSDEAARTLNLGALAGRNEFNSSFYTVIELPPARPQACAELLQRRGRVPADVALALSVIAGGNPREVLRLAELVSDATTGQDAIVRVLREETTALKREVVTADGGAVETEGRVVLQPMGEDARIGAFNALPDEVVESPAKLVDFGQRALGDDLWEPAWADDGWRDRFQEAWRRLLVRLTVGGRLAGAESIVRERDLELLQDVVVAASQSSAVGRIVLERRLAISSRRPTVQQPTARAHLDELIRGFPDSDSVELRDAWVSEARIAALDAEMDVDEIRRLLGSDVPPERVAGLAAVQATAHPELFDAVVESVQHSDPFEQFHALMALESLRPGLSPDRRGEATRVLRRLELAPDSARRALAERIIAGIERDETPLAAS